MNISAYNLGAYSCVNSFKGKNPVAAQQKTMGVERELPNRALYADCSNWMVPSQQRKELLEDYKAKIKSVVMDDNGIVDKRIIDFLDNKKVDIETERSGLKQKMTIKEAINSSIRDVRDFDSYLFHATAWREIGENIIKNGFDPTKISRTKLGPGFYFAGSEGGAREYSGCVLVADCKGKCASVKEAYFEKITNAGIISALANFIGFSLAGSDLGNAEYELCSHIINEYARNYLINDLGIDMAYGASGRSEACFAVYNPDIISNVRFMN